MRHHQDAYTGNDERGPVAEAQSVDDNSIPFSATPSKSNVTSPNETQLFGFDQIFVEGGEDGEPDVRHATMALYSDLTVRPSFSRLALMCSPTSLNICRIRPSPAV
jgi:hypothetical protein